MATPSIEIGKAEDGSIVMRTTVYISTDLARQLGASLTAHAGSAIIVPTLQIVPPTKD